ncbi:MAG: hypothetical protein ACTHJM_07715 [Marmoricola sp.]
MTSGAWRVRRRVALALAAGITAAAGVVATVPAAQASVALIGTFELTPGACTSSGISGTYLRMILPSGTANGPYMSNSDSTCSNQSYTPLQPGTDGGLVSGSYQPTPNPPFDSSGNALAGRITAPAQFYGTSFATSSNATDPQTHHAAPAPVVYANGTSLSANLAAFSVTWNKQYFNQGSPKPGGAYPGNTRPATGTYDPSTGAFTLTWTSQVVGGPFDKFTGQWHLAGRFVPASRAASGQRGTSTGTSAGGTGSSTRTGSVTGATSATGPSAKAAKAKPGSIPTSATAAGATTPVAASTTTLVTDHWHVDWWIVALAVAIALLGFVVLGLLNRKARASGADS